MGITVVPLTAPKASEALRSGLPRPNDDEGGTQRCAAVVRSAPLKIILRQIGLDPPPPDTAKPS
jgi:hypothetical protein